MKLYEVKTRTETLTAQLLTIWEASVRATHLFLSEGEIAAIKPYVPQALAGIAHLLIAEENDAPLGFMGIEDGKLEMLFLAPDARGKGIGKALIEKGIADYGVTEVAVNEQNPQAKGFYEKMGFVVYRRTERDEQGNPYPLLYLRLQK